MSPKFNDGVTIPTKGPIRLHRAADGLYVVGDGMSVPVKDQAEAAEVMEDMNRIRRTADDPSAPELEISHESFKRLTRGQCYPMAFYTLEALESQPKVIGQLCYLCHGTPRSARPGDAGQRMGHAWCEIETPGCRTLVLDHNLPGKAIDAKQYYKIGRMSTCHVRRYTLAEAYAEHARHGHHGPWEKFVAKAIHQREE